MNFLRRAYLFLNQRLNISIWLASILVILLILLLALTVNNAREKDTADLFSRQQLASAQSAASRMTEVLAQIERNIILFSHFAPQGRFLASIDYQEMEILYGVWGKTIEAVTVFDDQERSRRVMPLNGEAGVDLAGHFRILKRQQRQYLSLARSEKPTGDTSPQSEQWHLIWGYPEWRANNVFSGHGMVALSL